MEIMRPPMEYDQDDAERVIYEADFATCQAWMKSNMLDMNDFDLYPSEEELEDYEESEYADIEEEVYA